MSPRYSLARWFHEQILGGPSVLITTAFIYLSLLLLVATIADTVRFQQTQPAPRCSPAPNVIHLRWGRSGITEVKPICPQARLSQPPGGAGNLELEVATPDRVPLTRVVVEVTSTLCLAGLAIFDYYAARGRAERISIGEALGGESWQRGSL